MEVLLLKVLKIYFEINDYIYNCFIFSLFLPFFLYKIIINYRKPKWYDILTGILDFIVLLLISFSVNLTIGEYVSYRTSSIFFTVILLYFIDKKSLSFLKLLGVFIIFISCSLLIYFYGVSTNVVYIITCLIASLLYSVVNIIIEKYVITYEDKIINYYWTKTISCTINFFVALIMEIKNKTISNIYFKTNYLLSLLIISIVISFIDNYYYYIKTLVINSYENKDSGSMIINILDIIRRLIMLTVSIFVFKESYTFHMYICFSLMIVGILLYMFNKNKKIQHRG